MSLLSQISWAAGSMIVLAVSRFAFAVILARLVPPEIFGQYTYGRWIVDVSFLVCCLGVTGAISRYAAEYDHDKAFLVTIVHRWQFMAIGLPFVSAVAIG
jgi:O-antigen/teichoic acid export membrane protein